MLETEAFLKARTIFKKKADRQRGTVACVGWFSDKGGYVDDNNPQCHAGLLYWDQKAPRGAKPLAIFSGFQRDNSSSKDKKALGEFWFNYQKNHPVWGKGVLNTDFEDVWENGWVFDTKHPRNVLCSAIFATRWPTEHPNQCRAMLRYVQAGMQPDIAFVLSTISHADVGSGEISFYHRSGHMPCRDGAPRDFAERFVKYQTKNVGDNYIDSPGYSGIDLVFSNQDDYNGKGKSSPLYSLVEDSVSGKTGWCPSKDIFFTKAAWERERARKNSAGWSIQEKDLQKVAKAFNQYREEILR